METFPKTTLVTQCEKSGLMAACRGFTVTLFFLGTVCLVISSYRWNVAQRKMSETVLQQQNLRKMLIRKVCNRSGRETQRRKSSSGSIYNNLIVDDTHKIIYCFVPKVACTNWKRIMFILKLGKPYTDPASIRPSLVHGPKKLGLLKNVEILQRKEKLRDYTKFLFVRDPFVRLISAYRDKFQYKKENEYFYQKFGKLMLRLYSNQTDPPQTMQEAHALQMLPSFNHFIQYLLDPRTEREEPFDIHWRQMHRLCHPCIIRYDFIGHLETLQEEASTLLRLLNLGDEIKFPPSHLNMTTSDSVADWFETVTPEDRSRLYKLYEKDFRLFGYRTPVELFDS